jgi:hypothetical protein
MDFRTSAVEEANAGRGTVASRRPCLTGSRGPDGSISHPKESYFYNSALGQQRYTVGPWFTTVSYTSV